MQRVVSCSHPKETTRKTTSFLVGLALAISAACSSGETGGVAILPDADRDGLPDAVEGTLGSDPFDPDDPYAGGAFDSYDVTGPGGDGIPDGLERYVFDRTGGFPITARSDADLDGVPDYLEVRSGFDLHDLDNPILDGGRDVNDTGPSSDGIQDGLEGYLILHGATRPITKATDSDGDQIGDVLEVRTGSDPFDERDPFLGQWIDVDGDGLTDAFEVSFELYPLDGDRPLANGALDIRDEDGPPGDGISDALEFYLRILGSAPPITARSDSDGDGVPDYLEARTGSDIFDADAPQEDGASDSDHDGASDAVEALLSRFGASPVSSTSDTDGDRIADVLEIQTGSDPFEVADPTFFYQADVDLDGVPDVLEIRFATDPDDGDSPSLDGGRDVDDETGPAGDGISDAFEAIAVAHGVAQPVTTYSDADGDGVGDLLELLFFSALFDADSPESDGGGDLASPSGPAGDGISDALETVLLTLGVSPPITAQSDSDGDVLPDVIEIRTFSDPLDAGDPMPNRSPDVDGDGAPDYLELLALSDPLAMSDPVPDGGSDPDGDGLSTALEECLARLGVPGEIEPTTDTDGDGLFDFLEVRLPSDFLDRDHPVVGGGDTNDVTGPSGDGISDALEHYLIASGAVPPVTRLSDSDHDGIYDVYEARFVTGIFDPQDPLPLGHGLSDHDADGIIEAAEETLQRLGAPEVGPTTDLDGDFVPDYLELRIGSNPQITTDPSPTGPLDTDGDDIPESVVVLLERLGARPPIDGLVDGDMDGIPDVFEVTGPFRTVFQGLPAPDPGNADLPWPAGILDTDDEREGGGPIDLISDGLERMLIAIGARAPIDHGTDTDGDGAPDYLEIAAIAHPGSAHHPVPNGGNDTDEDLLSDALEIVLIRLGADAPLETATDSDDDGVPDYFEVAFRAHPLNEDYPVIAGGQDSNDATGPPHDGISDALEHMLAQLGTPVPVRTASETDGDGLPDYIEVRSGSDPFDGDSPLIDGGEDVNDGTGPSGDGISDALELYLIERGAIGPITTETDSDRDGVPDMIEILYGTDPFDPGSSVEGTAPMALDLRIEGLPFPGEVLTGSYLYFDADNDPEGDSIVGWLRDGVPIPGETTQHEVVEEDFGPSLAFTVTPVSETAFPPDTAVGPTVSVSGTISRPPFRGEGGPGGLGDAPNTSPTVWLRADHGVQTHPGSDRIVAWESSLEGGASATVLDSGMEPLLLPRHGPRNAPAIRFEGAQALELPVSPLAGFSLVIVDSTLSTSSSSSAYVIGQSSAALARNFLLGVTNTLNHIYIRNNRLSLPNAMTFDGLPHAFIVLRDPFSGSSAAHVDGVLRGTLSTFIQPIAHPTWLIGAGFQTGAFFEGEVYEILIHSDRIGTARRKLVEHYLYGRHGIQPLGQVVFHDWQSHGRDICGIGRSAIDIVDRAEGTGPLGMHGPTALSRGDYLLWGHDGSDELEIVSFGVNGYPHKLNQEWSIEITDGGNGDGVGLVDITLRLRGLDFLSVPNRWAILLTAADDSFHLSPATNYDPQEELMHFSSIDLTDVRFITFAIR